MRKNNQTEVDGHQLTGPSYWDNFFDDQIKRRHQQRQKNIVNWLKNALGYRAKTYAEYLLWKVIYPKYLPQGNNLKIVEIGSAPGWNLIQLHKLFSYDPYGIEYAEGALVSNKKRFFSAGLNPEQVIAADFFSEDLQIKYRESFDIVLSSGFLEHFDNPLEVIEKHVNLLKPGGTLVVEVPNFRGFNYWLGNYFDPGLKAHHNLEIMKKQNFSELFNKLGLEQQFCDFFGTLYFGLYFNRGHNKFKHLIRRFLVRFQVVLNLLFHAILGKRGAESQYFSPYLMYIGKKPIK